MCFVHRVQTGGAAGTELVELNDLTLLFWLTAAEIVTAKIDTFWFGRTYTGPTIDTST